MVDTKFQDERARRCINDAIERCPKDTKQWIDEHMRELEDCRWCFSTSTKRRSEGTGETGFSSSRRRRLSCEKLSRLKC
ncbi:hypothetical protein PHYSODRAFT_316830 [Phytophthora sojae]|uniref:Uncharacterized protein n=1 Tax=Phytophthora sojae (strain P6497) TaxID=1094619 RepID=G4ZRN0_PHYSP|nr:hypothetical protein PHYSODRAFT_316830 [Phytophthora sojae]EGZ13839.1 hypothetical protein PHYSODRAFT_316830 [Phytophthora sojae]|eukprot:XP_009531268.1 hypothetical protein PHYSODRAFT_316830 [Phytophthora sojae]